jgi:hypothetical protein
VARFAARGSDADLRAALLAEAIEIRDTAGYTLVRQGDQIVRGGRCPVSYTFWADQVDQLAGGGEFGLSRWELPADHPERFVGDLQDRLVLGVDNVLRLAG